MADIAELNLCAENLESALKLSSSPIAVKMLEKESDIPAGTLRPKKDRGFHGFHALAYYIRIRRAVQILDNRPGRAYTANPEK